MHSTIRQTLAALCITLTLQAPANADSVQKDKITDIKDLLTDSAAGHVSAASLLGVPAGAMTVVENTRGLVAAVNGLGTAEGSVGLSVAPGRTSIIPMSLETYRKGFFHRLVGNTTLAYAQGSAKVGTTDVMRRAYSIEWSTVLDERDDPVVGVLLAAPGQPTCRWEAPPVAPGQPADFGPANQAYAKCIDARLKVLSKKWNTSRVSFSLGGGSARPKDGVSTSLGRTVAAGLVYGFDHFGAATLRDGAAVALTLRHTSNDPVLDSLLTTQIKRKSTRLAALRVSGGTDEFRGLAEISSARASNGEVTAAQRVFRYAAGFDFRIAEGFWLTVRSGKQRKTNGIGDETATLMDFSYSPKSLLQ